jgi:hypothetical protein
MSEHGGVTVPDEPSHRHFPRSRLRILLPVGALLAVLVPIGVHVLRLDTPDAPGAASSRQARAFYVSPDGDDGHDGSSPAQAWRSLARADAVVFVAGDRLLLRGGARVRGAIGFGKGEAGDASTPVVVESYGNGRATIEAIGSAAIEIRNTAGVEIRNLAMVGDADAYAGSGGISLYSDLPDDRKLDHVVISQVDVSGFRHGIEIKGDRGTTGFRNVHISDSALHGNRDAGLITTGPTFNVASARYAHEAVSVSNIEAYDNPGNPQDRWNTTGNGIVLSSVRRGVIERSIAHDNGYLCNSEHGPVGIWAYDSTSVVIQHNVAFHNRTGGRTDGGGFGLDRLTSSSALQYNLSYDNDGAGYLVYGPPPGGVSTDSVVRFNISDNDARKTPGYSGITLGGLVSRAQIYHNTVISRASASGLPPALIMSGQLSATTIRNNIFMSKGTPLLFATEPYPPSQVLFQGNDLFMESSMWFIVWGPSTYNTLAQWRSATGQERMGTVDTGQTTDPGFATPDKVGDVDPSGGIDPTSGAAARARAFVLSNESPLLGEALDLRSRFGIDPGAVDYFGRPVTNTAAIGAAQPQVP